MPLWCDETKIKLHGLSSGEMNKNLILTLKWSSQPIMKFDRV